MIRNDPAPKSLFPRLRKASMLSLLAFGAAVGLVTSAMAVSPIQGIGGRGKVVLRVSDPRDTAALVAGGGRLVEDYQGFQLVEISEALAVGRGPSAEVLPDNNIIRLNKLNIDTASLKAQEARASVGSFQGKQLRLVSFVGPVKNEWAAQLEASGASIIAYIPNNAYLVYGDNNAISTYQLFSKSAPYVQWDGEFLPDYKVQLSGMEAKVTEEMFTIEMVDDASANEATRSLIDQFKLEPVYQEKKDTPEIKAMGRAFGKVGPSEGGRFFAWVTDGASPQEMAAITRDVPGPVLAVLNGVFGRGYRKSIAPVWQR